MRLRASDAGRAGRWPRQVWLPRSPPPSGDSELGRDESDGNGVADSCDTADGTSYDLNGNGVPDECEPSCTGDLNCDGGIDFADINPVINLLSGQPDPNCPVITNILAVCRAR